MSDFIARVGTFFYLVAVTFFVLFVASDSEAVRAAGEKANYDFFFVALILAIAGFFFRKRAAPPPAADRFRMIRKWRDDQKAKREEKNKILQQKK